MATRKEVPYGRNINKRHKLLVDKSVLSINQASEWGDIIAPLESIIEFWHSVLICHDNKIAMVQTMIQLCIQQGSQ